MSIISSKSNRDKQGFTPYQSDQELNDKEISLLSKLNLNDQINIDQSPKFEMMSFDKYSCDLRSVGSKKRKLSEEFINVNASKIGGKTFLNRSLIGKSSLDGSFIHELQFGDSHENGLKKQLSENSCPVVLNNEEREEFFLQPEQIEVEKPRFTKTKNLLRNISNYMHKFLLYSKRGERWLKTYFKKAINKRKRKESEEVSVSNRSSELSCFQQMCKIEDNIKIQDTPKMQAAMMQYSLPSRDQSDNFLNSVKQSLSLEEKSSLMKEEKQQNSNAKIEENSYLQMQVQNEMRQFQSWLSELSIVNFSDYESVWTKPHKFRGLYRMLCYKYYRSEAICDIYRSRLTTKYISASYLHQFIEGILQPSLFYRFK